MRLRIASHFGLNFPKRRREARAHLKAVRNETGVQSLPKDLCLKIEQKCRSAVSSKVNNE
jgi:hypothetical protein